jgi:hypothetical protein
MPLWPLRKINDVLRSSMISLSSPMYIEGDLVLLYDQAKEPLGEGKFNPMWHGPYIVRCVLEKGAYELEYYEGNVLDEPINGIYLKRYYT